MIYSVATTHFFSPSPSFLPSQGFQANVSLQVWILFKESFLFAAGRATPLCWKIEVQVTLHQFRIVSPCPCSPLSSSPEWKWVPVAHFHSVCSQVVFSQQLMWTLSSWVKSAWGSIGGRAWGLSLNTWPWLLMKNRIWPIKTVLLQHMFYVYRALTYWQTYNSDISNTLKFIHRHSVISIHFIEIFLK